MDSDTRQQSNLLVDRLPELTAEWAKTNELDLNSIAWQSNRKVDWVCGRGHCWTQSVQGRIRHQGDGSMIPCRMCRSLAVIHPDIAAEWHPSNDKPALDVLRSSAFEARWICALGHEWTAKVNTRVSMSLGCPYCGPSGRVLAGFNDLATKFPELALEWDDQKNEMSSSEVRPGVDTPAWWICPEGHSYDMSVYLRISRGQECPYCAGRRVLRGFNDLGSLYPSVVAQWSSRNDRSPFEVTVKSSYEAEWVCSQGHTWVVAVPSRTASRSGDGLTQCPHCWGGRQSQIERRVWDRLPAEGFSDLVTGARTPVKWGRARFSEVDALLPAERVVIEYDGWYWHCNDDKTSKDRLKTQALLDAGWGVIRIREDPLESLGVDHFDYDEVFFRSNQYLDSDVDCMIPELMTLLKKVGV